MHMSSNQGHDWKLFITKKNPNATSSFLHDYWVYNSIFLQAYGTVPAQESTQELHNFD